MEKKEIKRYGIIALLIVAVCFVVKHFSLFGKLLSVAYSAVYPLLLGAVIAYIFNIILSALEKHYFPKTDTKAVRLTRRPVCIILSFLCAAAIIALILKIVIPEMINAVKLISGEIPPLLDQLSGNIIKKLAEYPDIQQEAMELFEEFDVKSLDWASITEKAADVIQNGVMGIITSAVGIVGTVTGFVTNAVLAVIFAIYLLLRKDKLRRDVKRMQKAFISDKINSKVNKVFKTADTTFKSFFIGQFLEAILLGCFCYIGMKILKLPYAAMSSVLVGVTALIPVVGAFIGAGVSAFIIFTESPMQTLIFLIFLVILQQLEGNVVYPKVVGNSIGLPGIWVLAAVTVGGGLWGVVGMLIGVPLAATAYKLFFEHLENKEKQLGIKSNNNEVPKKSEKKLFNFKKKNNSSPEKNKKTDKPKNK
ncbi:MAG: AI-2E family transporter [Ruminococcus sp.]|nr:AI-2E family transporter [Ruminococcus sp.]